MLESLLNRKGEAQPVLDLLDEMTAKRIKLEEPALRALVNWGIAAGDLRCCRARSSPRAKTAR